MLNQAKHESNQCQGASQTRSSMGQLLKCRASLGSLLNAFVPRTVAQRHGSTGQLLKCIAPWCSDCLRQSLLLFLSVAVCLQSSFLL